MGFSLILLATVPALDYSPEDAWRDVQIELRKEKSPTAHRRMT